MNILLPLLRAGTSTKVTQSESANMQRYTLHLKTKKKVQVPTKINVKVQYFLQ